MFEAATNREEYYKLLAQKMYHIQKEREDRENQRKLSASNGMGRLVTCCLGGFCVILKAEGLDIEYWQSGSSMRAMRSSKSHGNRLARQGLTS